MTLSGDAQLLRIYIGELTKHGHHPIYDLIVTEARKRDIAGATVLRGPIGYGHSHRMHTAKILELSSDLPLVIEIVETEEKIAEFLPFVKEVLAGRGLITLEKVQVVPHEHRTT